MSSAPEQDLLEEGLAPLAVLIPDGKYRYPAKGDSPRSFRSKRNALLSKIVPMSIIPLATANAMLLLGSAGAKCYFPLPQYLLLAGLSSLALAIGGIVARYVLHWVLWDHAVTPGEAVLLTVMEYMVLFLVVTQVGVLVAGTLILLPYIGELSTDPADEEKFCDGSLVLFALVFLSTFWVFMFFALACYAYLWCYRGPEDLRDAVSARVMLLQLQPGRRPRDLGPQSRVGRPQREHELIKEAIDELRHYKDLDEFLQKS